MVTLILCGCCVPKSHNITFLSYRLGEMEEKREECCADLLCIFTVWSIGILCGWRYCTTDEVEQWVSGGAGSAIYVAIGYVQVKTWFVIAMRGLMCHCL